MTALENYDRLEATGLWRADATAQRREVVVSIGDATLKIADMSDRVLTHWSLAAMLRANPGQFPAIYHPDGDPSETLELGEDETTMIDAIARIQRVVARRKSRPGRLRWGLGVAVVALLFLVSAIWLPAGLRGYALRVIPDSQRAELGEALLTRLERAAGRVCTSDRSTAILSRLAGRTGAGRLHVLPDGRMDALHLPGGVIILHRSTLEDHDDPAVPAGFILAEMQRAMDHDPLDGLLRHTGLGGTLTLLTHGALPPEALDSYAETILTSPARPVDQSELLLRFAVAGLPSTPYARAVDPTGQSVQALIDGDPFAPGERFDPPLSDADWLRLQQICER